MVTERGDIVLLHILRVSDAAICGDIEIVSVSCPTIFLLVYFAVQLFIC